MKDQALPDVVAGVDVGGTFTDVLLHDPAGVRCIAWKLPTTHDNPARAVARGIAEACALAGLDPARVTRVQHGTTIATNAMLESRGGPVGFITNEGFRDVLHIGRHRRPMNYSIRQDIPWQVRPLVRRRDRLTVAGRLVPPDGTEEVPLDEAAVRAAARTLAGRGIGSVVIGFLFSFLNPAHELRAREIVLDETPDAFVTLSHEISGQFREFERFTTAAVNGFVAPGVRRYIADLDAQLRTAGLAASLRIMTSSGAAAPAARIAERPALTLLSGPAAGVIGGCGVGLRAGRRELVTFDVGGTSADIGIIVGGEIREAGARDMEIGGFPVQLPMIDIETIGAGGGSIASRDPGGGFRVGPQSAGSFPGPAAYGRGGTEPTATDAHLVLGRLDPERFLGGRMRLDTGAALAAVGRLADELGLTAEATAAGVLRILNEAMAEAIRRRTVRRGLDPRDFALVAFGGAGPLHAAEVAALLDIPEVLIPPFPGLTSAAGLLETPLRYDHVRSAFLRSDRGADGPRLAALAAELGAAVRADLERDGVAAGAVEVQLAADLRYLGQGYELRVPVTGDGAGPADGAAMLAGLRAAFDAAHGAEYGRAFPERVVELVNLRASGRVADGVTADLPLPPAGAGPAEVGLAEVGFALPDGAVRLPTPFVMRDRLAPGARRAGPLVVLQDDTTVIVPPGFDLVALPEGALLLSRRKEQA